MCCSPRLPLGRLGSLRGVPLGTLRRFPQATTPGVVPLPGVRQAMQVARQAATGQRKRIAYKSYPHSSSLDHAAARTVPPGTMVSPMLLGMFLPGLWELVGPLCLHSLTCGRTLFRCSQPGVASRHRSRRMHSVSAVGLVRFPILGPSAGVVVYVVELAKHRPTQAHAVRC